MWAYDVEILPNFFSITFVDIIDYVAKFEDACKVKIKKGKEIKEPIPLVEKYSVKDIIAKLDTVHKKQFYITDKDDSQLLPMVGFINNLGNEKTHCFGFNNRSYDRLMVSCLLMYLGIYNTTRELITKLYETSKKIIELQDNKDASNNDYYLSSLRENKLPYYDIDIFRIFALNKIGQYTKEDGTKGYFGKSLKQTSINIKWYEILEHELPPIDDEEAQYYLKRPRYSGLTLDELNKIIDKWDRIILDKYIPQTMHYNTNDSFIVCEVVRLYWQEIKLRYTISVNYGLDVLNSSRSDMADKLFIKYYSEFSNLQPYQWRGKKTERTIMSFNKVIFDNVKFKTPKLQNFLNDIRTVAITQTGKSDFSRSVVIGETEYTIATGGLHTKDRPRNLKSTNDYIYSHYDISSFYPSLICAYRIAPKHLDEGVFVKLVDYFRTTRIQAKHSEDPLVDGIPKEVVAEALKIVINSIYGKFNSVRC